MPWKILIVRSAGAFLPEADAYTAILRDAGYYVDTISGSQLADISVRPDLVIRFGGFLLRPAIPGVPEIHDYASASLRPFPRLKNTLKSSLSCAALGYIFLNPFVRDQLHFGYKAPFIYRDMGADNRFYKLRDRGPETKSFDVVYAGSMLHRPGLIDCLLRLKGVGATVAVAGDASRGDALTLSRAGVEFVGRLPSYEVPNFIASGHFGLNFCPDRYPFRYQTSTKVIEYLTAGIPVLSNRYSWIEAHSRKLGYQYLDVDAVRNMSDLIPVPGMRVEQKVAQALTWGSVLEASGFLDFISGCLNRMSS